ncbi:spirocyclase AveC family protein [Ideonella sp. B508-1]|uniref:spirocyclase AveC family protein n=1 Tax=Ideonella sp. B508-1 TaxID=137716 RepID=UPI0003491C0E|nr:spirocyclase AveC family protein [Ideonella sp. B508-1]
MSIPLTRERFDAPAGSRLEAIHWWAAIGGLLVLLQAWIYIAWIRSDKFVPTDPGPDPLPRASEIGLPIFQALSVLTLVAAVAYFGRTLLRREPLAPIQVLMLGWLFTFWQDPWLNMFRPTFTYNAHLLNFGSWSEFIPGWVSPHGSRIPEPILINFAAYVFQLPLSCLFGWWAMRKAKARFPAWGGVRLFLAGLVAMVALDMAQEILATRVVHYDAFPAAAGPKLWDGEFYQIPLYEFLFFPLVLAASSALFFFRDDRGRMVVERGVDRLRVGDRTRDLLRVLAVTAFANLMNAGYVFTMAFLSLHADPWPQMPSWMRDNVCGAGTVYECPGPEVPIPTLTSRPVPPTSGRN